MTKQLHNIFLRLAALIVMMIMSVGVWGQTTTIASWIQGTATGCTQTGQTGAINSITAIKASNSGGSASESNAGYITLLGNTLQTGDKITVKACYTNDDTKTVYCLIGSDNATPFATYNSGNYATITENVRKGSNPGTYEFTVVEAGNEESSFYIQRATNGTGTNLFVTEVIITREEPNTNLTSITINNGSPLTPTNNSVTYQAQASETGTSYNISVVKETESATVQISQAQACQMSDPSSDKVIYSNLTGSSTITIPHTGNTRFYYLKVSKEGLADTYYEVKVGCNTATPPTGRVVETHLLEGTVGKFPTGWKIYKGSDQTFDAGPGESDAALGSGRRLMEFSVGGITTRGFYLADRGDKAYLISINSGNTGGTVAIPAGEVKFTLLVSGWEGAEKNIFYTIEKSQTEVTVQAVSATLKTSIAADKKKITDCDRVSTTFTSDGSNYFVKIRSASKTQEDNDQDNGYDGIQVLGYELEYTAITSTAISSASVGSSSLAFTNYTATQNFATASAASCPTLSITTASSTATVKISDRKPRPADTWSNAGFTTDLTKNGSNHSTTVKAPLAGNQCYYYISVTDGGNTEYYELKLTTAFGGSTTQGSSSTELTVIDSDYAYIFDNITDSGTESPTGYYYTFDNGHFIAGATYYSHKKSQFTFNGEQYWNSFLIKGFDQSLYVAFKVKAGAKVTIYNNGDTGGHLVLTNDKTYDNLNNEGVVLATTTGGVLTYTSPTDQTLYIASHEKNGNQFGIGYDQYLGAIVVKYESLTTIKFEGSDVTQNETTKEYELLASEANEELEITVTKRTESDLLYLSDALASASQEVSSWGSPLTSNTFTFTAPDAGETCYYKLKVTRSGSTPAPHRAPATNEIEDIYIFKVTSPEQTELRVQSQQIVWEVGTNGGWTSPLVTGDIKNNLQVINDENRLSLSSAGWFVTINNTASIENNLPKTAYVFKVNQPGFVSVKASAPENGQTRTICVQYGNDYAGRDKQDYTDYGYKTQTFFCEATSETLVYVYNEGGKIHLDDIEWTPAVFTNTVSLNNSSISNNVGYTETLTPTVDAGYNCNYVWTSSDESVAMVDQNGKVTLVGGGYATITLTVKKSFSETITATCNVSSQAEATGAMKWVFSKTAPATNPYIDVYGTSVYTITSVANGTTNYSNDYLSLILSNNPDIKTVNTTTGEEALCMRNCSVRLFPTDDLKEQAGVFKITFAGTSSSYVPGTGRSFTFTSTGKDSETLNFSQDTKTTLERNYQSVDQITLSVINSGYAAVYSIEWIPKTITWVKSARSVKWRTAESLRDNYYYEEYPEYSGTYYQYNVKTSTFNTEKPLIIATGDRANGSLSWSTAHALGFKLSDDYNGVTKVYFRSTKNSSMKLLEGSNDTFSASLSSVGSAAGVGDNESTPATLFCNVTKGKTYWITANSVKDGDVLSFAGFDLILYRNEQFGLKSGASATHTITPADEGSDNMNLDKVFRSRLQASVEVENGAGEWLASGNIPMTNAKLTYSLLTGNDVANVSSSGAVTIKKNGTFTVKITLAAGEYQKGGVTYVYPEMETSTTSETTITITVNSNAQTKTLAYANSTQTEYLQSNQSSTQDVAWQTLKVDGANYTYDNENIKFTFSTKFIGETYTITIDETNHKFVFPTNLPQNGDVEITVTATYAKEGEFTMKASCKQVVLTDIQAYPLVTPDAWRWDLDYLTAPNEMIRRYYISSDDVAECNAYIPFYDDKTTEIQYEVYNSSENKIDNSKGEDYNKHKGSSDESKILDSNGAETNGSKSGLLNPRADSNNQLIQIGPPKDADLIKEYADFNFNDETNKCLMLDAISAGTNTWDNELRVKFDNPLTANQDYTLTLRVYSYASYTLVLWGNHNNGQWYGGGSHTLKTGWNEVSYTFNPQATQLTELRLMLGTYLGSKLAFDRITFSGNTSEAFDYDFSSGSVTDVNGAKYYGKIYRVNYHHFGMAVQECREMSPGLTMTNISKKTNLWDNSVNITLTDEESALVTTESTISMNIYLKAGLAANNPGLGICPKYLGSYEVEENGITITKYIENLDGSWPGLGGNTETGACWRTCSATLPAPGSTRTVTVDGAERTVTLTKLQSIDIRLGTFDQSELYINNIKLKCGETEVLGDRQTSRFVKNAGDFTLEHGKMADHSPARGKGVKDVLITYYKKVGSDKKMVRRERHVFYFIKAPQVHATYTTKTVNSETVNDYATVTMETKYKDSHSNSGSVDNLSNYLYYTKDMSIPRHLYTDDATISIDALGGDIKNLNTKKYISAITQKSNVTFNAAQFIKVPKPCFTPTGELSKRFTLISNEKEVRVYDDEVLTVQKGKALTAGIDGMRHVTTKINGTDVTTLHVMYGCGAGSAADPVHQAWYRDPSRGFVLSDLTWSKGETENGAPSLDGFEYLSRGSGDNANPYMEVGGHIGAYNQDLVPGDQSMQHSTTIGVRPEDGGLFLNPIAGDFIRLEPEYDGVLSLWIRQNGASDNSTQKTGELARRPVYCIDENGYIMRRTTYKPTADSYYCVNGIFATINKRKSKFRYDFENTWNYGLEHWSGVKNRKSYRFYSHMYPWLTFKESIDGDTERNFDSNNYPLATKVENANESKMKVNFDVDNIVSRYNYINGVIYDSRKLGIEKYELTHSHNDQYGTWEHTVKYSETDNWLTDFANYGYELPNFYWVRYRMPLKAGKTYYFGGRVTKNGVIAIKFEMLEANYHPKDYRNSDNNYLYDTNSNDTGEADFTASTTYTRDKANAFATYNANYSGSATTQYQNIVTKTLDESDANTDLFTAATSFRMYDNTSAKTDADIAALSDETMLSDAISNNPFTGYVLNVKVKRKFTAGKIHPIVLPFSVSETRMREIFGDDVIVLYLDPDQSGQTTTAGKFNLKTVQRSAIDGPKIKFTRHFYQMLYANVPAFIIPSFTWKDSNANKNVGATYSATDKTKTDITFERVTYEGNTIREYNIGGGYKVTGSYSCTDNSGKEMYYVANSNDDHPTVYYAQTGQKLKGTRVWIEPIPTASGVSAPQRLTEVGFLGILDEDLDENYDSIKDILEDIFGTNTSSTEDLNIYNLQGMIVGAVSESKSLESFHETLPSGVYIFSGQKFIVKNR